MPADRFLTRKMVPSIVPTVKTLALLALTTLVASCNYPFLFGKSKVHSGPNALSAAFDSATASARLRWQKPAVEDFRRYRIERSNGKGFAPVAEVFHLADTSHVDDGLLSNEAYQYRVVTVFGGGPKGSEAGNYDSLLSVEVAGGIHRFVNAWPVAEGFLPTRMALNSDGVLHVVGAGANWVERFDRSGNSMGRLQYAAEENACLETGTLDGPGVAFDIDDNLYVLYNSKRPGQSPQARWSKFDVDGNQLWTADLNGVFARHIAIHEREIFIESISHLKQFDTSGESVADYRVPALLVSSLRFWHGNFAALVEPLNFAQVGWQSPRLVIYSGATRDQVEAAIGRDPMTEEDRGAGLLNRPSDFVVDESTDRAFVVNAGRGRIEVFRDGEYLTRWGKRTDGSESFNFTGSLSVIDDMSDGSLREKEVVAGGIARDADGYIYVADTFGNRIHKFLP
jgi:hypothetical protein